MDPRYSIVRARPQDLEPLRAIELAAAELLRGHAPDSVLNEATNIEDLREAQRRGLLWVALDDDRPVGFALLEISSEHVVHLEEIDVHPRHGRRGVGAALLRAILDWAVGAGLREVTLTTLRAVPWNMPFYSRMGFREVPRAQWTRELTAIVAKETARGLDPERRVVMSHSLDGSAAPAPRGSTAPDS